MSESEVTSRPSLPRSMQGVFGASRELQRCVQVITAAKESANEGKADRLVLTILPPSGTAAPDTANINIDFQSIINHYPADKRKVIIQGILGPLVNQIEQKMDEMLERLIKSAGEARAAIALSKGPTNADA